MKHAGHLHDIRVQLHKDIHALMEVLKIEEWDVADTILKELLAKYSSYEADMLDDYAVLYEADFYLREGTSTFSDFLRAYNQFLKRLYPKAEQASRKKLPH